MYQLVFEIVRRTIELSRFRYSYAFLTHFSQWGPVLNDCSFSCSSLKYDSQPVWPALVCRSWEMVLGKAE